MRTLAIISHTEHYEDADGTIYGLGSTVTEINHLLKVFDHIYHLGMLHEGRVPASALPYSSDRITFVALPALGGRDLSAKLALIFKAPLILRTIRSTLIKVNYFQFRAPTGIGVYVIPYLIGFSSTAGWFKYAGNWNQKQAPLAYAFQRWLLKHQKRKVTINGRWPDQPRQCLTFENPCLSAVEVELGKALVETKIKPPDAICLCFVGRLEEAKGVGIFLQALKHLEASEKAKIMCIAIVGDGPLRQQYQEESIAYGLPITFHGYLARHEVHEIYKRSHAIVLPSVSEGFPKVIAEAMNYGCIPIVSDVSSLSQYVKNDVNGYLLQSLSAHAITKALLKILYLSDDAYDTLIHKAREDHAKFTYAHYNQRIMADILNSKP